MNARRFQDDHEDQRKCKHCDSPAVFMYTRWLCVMHHRFRQMCADSSTAGKLVPSYDQLAELAQGMKCADCAVALNWRAKDGRSTAATLQHYRDGTIAIVCQSCNTRHSVMPGDSFRALPAAHKWCGKCRQVKPYSDFHADRAKDRLVKLKGHCKACSAQAQIAWAVANKDRCKAVRRKRYQLQKGVAP